jgi:dephospho-CoA kinase
MLKVALTGGIATGKSYVLARLKDRGIPVIDADDVVHEAFGAGKPVTNAIAARFGSRFLNEDGSVCRALLGVEVFKDSETRRQVEAIVHPLVYDAIQKWFDTLDAGFGVASIPLLFETSREKDFDFVAVTDAPADVQLRRLLDRAAMTREGARQRIAAQMPAQEKASRGHFVINTGGEKADTDRQVDDLIGVLQKIIAGSKSS